MFPCTAERRGFTDFTWCPSCCCEDSWCCSGQATRRFWDQTFWAVHTLSRIPLQTRSITSQLKTIDERLTSCLFLLAFSLFHLSWSTSPAWSPAEFRLWAPGDHEEAAGETCSQYLRFRGGVFWWRQHSLSSSSSSSSLLYSHVIFSTCGCCVLTLLILRQLPTPRSLWRSFGAGRICSSCLHRNRWEDGMLCHVCLTLMTNTLDTQTLSVLTSVCSARGSSRVFLSLTLLLNEIHQHLVMWPWMWWWTCSTNWCLHSTETHDCWLAGP